MAESNLPLVADVCSVEEGPHASHVPSTSCCLHMWLAVLLVYAEVRLQSVQWEPCSLRVKVERIFFF